MKGIITINEARIEIGKPELDEKEFPEANQIWNDSQETEEFSQETRPSVEKDFGKAVKKKDKTITSPGVTKREENFIISKRDKFWDKVQKESYKIIDDLKQRKFLKKVPNVKKEMDNVNKFFVESTLGAEIIKAINKKYKSTGKQVSLKLGQKFKPFKAELKFLEKYNLDLVKVKDARELEQIKQRIEVGIMNNQSATELKSSIDQIRKTSKGHTQTLVRTELNRANNMGGLQAMKQSGGDVKKYLDITSDHRTSQQSKLFDKKYGTEEKAIPLDKEFKITYKNKIYSGQAPPFMPNDRDKLLYTVTF